MWPGMFQAEAGRGIRPNVRSTRDAMSATAASYAIPDEQRATKKVLDNATNSGEARPTSQMLEKRRWFISKFDKRLAGDG
jgi:hypothetical protein